jgi:ABC-type oligopeptide transport system substrate-binding subunit
MKSFIPLTLLMAFISAPAFATSQSSMSLYGDIKYPVGFTHFDYVNPNAPKGGTLKLPAISLGRRLTSPSSASNVVNSSCANHAERNSQWHFGQYSSVIFGFIFLEGFLSK